MPHLTLAGGRVLTYELSGDPDGHPVFLQHGTPGSHSGPKPRSSALYQHRINLVAYNRPGYGGSTRQAERRVADAAGDVAAMADMLGFDRFAILGRSGGGPHALACAALLPERVTRAAVLVSVAPPDAVGLNWFGRMVDSNVRAYSTASEDVVLHAEQVRLRADRVRRDPSYLIRQLRQEMSPPDLRIVDDLGIQRQLLRTYEQALAEGPGGWIDDVRALRTDWGFRLQDIGVPVRLWHGADDQFAPVNHTVWLAERIPSATLEIDHGEAHFGALRVMPELMGWLVAQPDPSPASAGPV